MTDPESSSENANTIIKYLDIGLSGWLIAVLTLVLGYFGFKVWRRTTNQKNIKAGGSVAGGSIIKGPLPRDGSDVRKSRNTKTRQKNIEAGEDVSGEDIIKG